MELLVYNQNRNKFLQFCVFVFDGNFIEYCIFVCVFENLVEFRIFSSIDRFYYFEQFIVGDVKEFVRFCYYLLVEEGYDEVCRFLRRKYGDDYCIVFVYEMKVFDWLSIKVEDGVVLNCFLVFFVSCKNVLVGSQYIFKFDQLRNI